MSSAGFVDSTAWERSHVLDALQCVAVHLRALPVRDLRRAPSTTGSSSVPELAHDLGLHARAVEFSYGSIPDVPRAAPSIVELPGDRFLVVTRRCLGRVELILGNGSRQWIRERRFVAEVRRLLAGGAHPEFARWLELAEIPVRRRERAQQRLAAEWLHFVPLVVWTLARPRRGNFVDTLRGARVDGDLLRFVSAHLAQSALWIGSWIWLGPALLRGVVDSSSVFGWTLLLFSMVLVQCLRTWYQGRIAIRGGALLRRWLLESALRLDLESVRRRGAGELLGRVLESQGLEQLALNGGFFVLAGLFELILIAILLDLVAGPILATLLLATALVAVLLGFRLLARRKKWTAERLALSEGTIEAMLGHRTRLVQRDQTRPTREDAMLARYHALSRRLDASLLELRTAVPRVWSILALLFLLPLTLRPDVSMAALAASVGVILLAYNSLTTFTEGIVALTGAWVAADRVAPLLRTPEPSSGEGPPSEPEPIANFASAPSVDRNIGPHVVARGISFLFPERSRAALDGVTFELPSGSRTLLLGPSGAGKSTLSSILSGLRSPSSGFLLLDGLDAATLGTSEWRQRVGLVPQFQENHVFANTLSFNLLLGRPWPPQPAELERAEEVCRALGLGPLLERMPARLAQPVGDGGWALSDGEKSRVFVARALLHQPGLLVLDESFGPVDPETLIPCLDACLARVPSLVVVRHP